jgi:hypothetical protein
MKTMLPIRLLVSLLFVFVISVVCNGQAVPPQKTFVSGVGDDANPCSRTAPCLTFAGALSKTSAGGEIDVLDPGDFGPVTITQAVTIIARGFDAGISVTAGNAITITVGGTVPVVLKGLTLDGGGTATAGIRVNGAFGLQVENCTINNFAGNGIDYNSNINGSLLQVRDTTIRNNGTAGNAATGGAYVHQAGSVGVRATFDNVHFDHNNIGLRVDDNDFVTVKNSDVLASNSTGVLAMSTSLAATIDMENCVVALGLMDGITSKGFPSSIMLSNVSVLRNSGFGLRETNGAIVSFGNNRVYANSVDGNPTMTVTQR